MGTWLFNRGHTAAMFRARESVGRTSVQVGEGRCDERRPASNARLIPAFSHVCGQVQTEVRCSEQEGSAYVPRQTRRWGSGGRGFDPDRPTNQVNDSSSCL